LRVLDSENKIEEFWIDKDDIDETGRKENFFGV
jgi:hypothetical protein